MTGGLSAIDITVECTLSWRVRSNIRFLSAWAGGVLQILWSDWYREWTVFSRPARSQRAVSNPLRVESPSEHCSFYKQMFRSQHVADISFINSLFSPSLSLSLTLSQTTLDSFVVANYELLNGLSRGLTIVCNLMILLKKQLRKNKNTRYFLAIAINPIYFLKSAKQLVCFKTSSNDLRSTICYKYTFVESLQVR